MHFISLLHGKGGCVYEWTHKCRKERDVLCQWFLTALQIRATTRSVPTEHGWIWSRLLVSLSHPFSSVPPVCCPSVGSFSSLWLSMVFLLRLYRFSEGNCFTEAVCTLRDKTVQGLFPGAGSECRDHRDAEQRAVPGAGRSAGSRPSCCGVGEAPERLRPRVSPGAKGWPAESRSARAAWLEGQREREGTSSARELLKGYPFDVRELLRYLSWLV